MNATLFHHDSVQMARAVEGTYNTGVVQPAVGGRYGLVIIYVLPYILFHNAYLVTTIMTILFAALSIVILYLLLKLIFNNDFIPISASLMFAFSPLYLSMTTYAKSHAMAIFLVLLSLYLFVKSIKGWKWGYALCSILVFLYSLTVRIDNILWLPIFALFFLFPSWYVDVNITRTKNKLYYIVILIPILLFFILNLFTGIVFKYGQDKIIWDFNRIIYQISGMGLRVVYSVNIIVFVLFVAASIYVYWKKSDNLLILCGVWFLSLWFPMSLINVTSARFWAGALIPIFIILSVAYYKIPKHNGYAVVITILIMFVSIAPILYHRHTIDNNQALIQELDALGNNDIYVAMEDYNVFIKYYSNYDTIGLNEDMAGKKVYSLAKLVPNRTTKVAATFIWEDYHHSELSSKLKKETIVELI